jgi:hypothetical protein
LKAKLIGIFGNNDGDRDFLKRRFKEINAEVRGSFAEVSLGSFKIVMVHGDDLELLTSLIGTQNYDVVVHAHSHEAKIYRKGKTLVINPGEVCGYLSNESTIALLDTQSMDAKILRI